MWWEEKEIIRPPWLYGIIVCFTNGLLGIAQFYWRLYLIDMDENYTTVKQHKFANITFRECFIFALLRGF